MPCFMLETSRLRLRPPESGDVQAIAAQMNDWDVVKNLARAPFPYTEDDARRFLAFLDESRARGIEFAFAVTRKPDDAPIGLVGVHLRETRFELGYWIGRAHWGQGYATEAAAEVLGFAFRNLRAESVEAGWFHDNPASGRVLEKLGFQPAGTGQRDCVARRTSVLCNQVIMSRAEFGQRQAA